MSHLEKKMAGILESMDLSFRHDYKFLESRKFKVDFCLPRYMIAIECEGGVYINGRHNNAIGYIRDAEKYNLLTLEGWSLLRFTTKDFKDPESIVKTIISLINKKQYMKFSHVCDECNSLINM